MPVPNDHDHADEPDVDEVDDDDADAGDGDGAPTSPPEGRMARLERMLAPKPAVPPTRGRKGGNPTKWSIDRLDARESLYCYAASVIALVFSVLIFVSEDKKNFHPVKGQLSPTTGLIIGLTSAVLLAVTTRIGRRALVGFVALFAFLGFNGSGGFIGFPFLVLAGWLLYRSYKVQKEATAKLREERAAGGGTAGGSDRPVRPAKGAAAAGRSRADARRAGRAKGPSTPEGNKRYTPKKPAPKPIPQSKPSWRERRAAKASD
jgi:hypothetical protein